MKAFLLVVAVLATVAAGHGEGRAQDAPASPPASIAQLDADAAAAKQRVIEIVNKPITHLPRTDQPALFSPGWFHPGAEKPDFDTVDVRATQQFIYDDDNYVTSDLNPTEMFIGRELEFNAMTKYFYVDRTLPKAKLSDAEMQEINRLYRVIGRDEQAHAARDRMALVLVLVAILLIAALFLIRRFL